MQCGLSKASFRQKLCIYVPTVLVLNFICSTSFSYSSLDLTLQIISVIAIQQTLCFLGQWKLFAGPDRCRKLIFKSCSTLSTSSTTPIYHFSSNLQATYSFRRTDSEVILPKSGSPVMLNEPANASSFAVRLYIVRWTRLKENLNIWEVF